VVQENLSDPFAKGNRTRHYHSGVLRADRLAMMEYKPPPNIAIRSNVDQESYNLETKYRAIRYDNTEQLTFNGFDLPIAYFNKHKEC